MTVREVWQRLRGAFGGGPSETELRDELRFHREMMEERFRARGLAVADAQRMARLAVGGDAQIAEAWRDQRGLPFFDTLWQDVRYGLRTLRRAPGFSTAALATLSIGIGANTAMFSVVDAVLLRPLPYSHPDRIVTIGDRNAEGFSANIGFETMVDLQARSRSFESLALMRSWQPTLVTNGEAERLPAVRVSWNYFDLLGVQPALGRGFTPEDDRPEHWRVVALSDRLWRRRFGADPGIVGRTIVMNDREYRVVAVMPASLEALAEQRYFNADAQMWAPIGYALHGDSACRSCRHLRGFGRLRAGATLQHASAELNTIRDQMRREHPTDYEAGSIAVVPLKDAVTGNVRTTLVVLLGAVAFVLLIACANVANLLLARSVTRQRELALRGVLGAGRGRIVRQLLTESAMLGAGGAVLGTLLAFTAVRMLDVVAPVSLPRVDHVAVDGRVLLFTALLTLAASVVFGLAPAWRAASGSRALAVDSRTTTAAASRARAALVVADLILALVLLAGAGVMLRTMAALAHADPGFNPDGILSLQFSLVGQAYQEDAAVFAFQQRALARLRAIPGVAAAALADQIPFGTDYDCRAFHAKGRMKPNTVDDPCVERYGITPDYLRAMQVPLLAGRSFTDADTADSQPVLLVSRSTAKAIWGDDDPIGAQVSIGSAEKGPWRTVVGVVGDVHHDDLTAPPELSMYTPQSQMTDSYLVAVLKTSGADPDTFAGPARNALHELDATVPVYAVATAPSLVAKSAGQRLFLMRLLAGFGGVAVLLAAVGLYGVISYGIAQRTREVGLRIALGAQPRDVLMLVLLRGFTLVGIGVTAGLAAAAAATRSLRTLVFGVSPSDPSTLAAAAAVLTLAALLAHWIPVRRALRIDPATALRTE